MNLIALVASLIFQLLLRDFLLGADGLSIQSMKEIILPLSIFGGTWNSLSSLAKNNLNMARAALVSWMDKK